MFARYFAAIAASSALGLGSTANMVASPASGPADSCDAYVRPVCHAATDTMLDAEQSAAIDDLPVESADSTECMSSMTPSGFLLPIPFVSQRDYRWRCSPYGAGCSGTYIGDCAGASHAGGCALCACTSLAQWKGWNVSPAQLNGLLASCTNCGTGYAWDQMTGCYDLIIWGTVACLSGQRLTFEGAGVLTNPTELRNRILQGRTAIVSTPNGFGPHWVAVRGFLTSGSTWADFIVWDPWEPSSSTASKTLAAMGAGYNSPARYFR